VPYVVSVGGQVCGLGFVIWPIGWQVLGDRFYREWAPVGVLVINIVWGVCMCCW